MRPGYANDRALLNHIRRCIDRIRTYTNEGRAAFFSSDIVQDAVARNLQTLAESTQRLSPSLKSTEPDMPWKGIAGFRNVLVHNYLGLDYESVWEIVENRLPELESAVERMARVLAEADEPPSHSSKSEI